MLKKSILAVAALGVMHVANAQELDSLVSIETRAADKHLVETNHFGSNWFVSVQGGAQMYFADHTNTWLFGQKSLGTSIDNYAHPTFAFDVNFGKWFTPGIGIRMGVSGMNFKQNLTNGVAGHRGNLNPVTRRDGYRGTAKTPGGFKDGNIKYLRGHADVLFNLSQMILGYKSDRFYSFIPYASIGYAGSLNKPLPVNPEETLDAYNYFDKNGTQSMTLGLGILNTFRLTDRLDAVLDLGMVAYTDRFDAQYGGWDGFRSRHDGALMATIGLSYDLGMNHWHCSTVTTSRVNETVLNDLREKMNTLEVTNDDLRQQLEDCLNRDVTPDNVCGMPLFIPFHLDRWMLCNKARINLGFLAEALKANPKMVYKVTGFADKGTGSVRRNVFLAKKRAEVVYNCLVKEFGVPESQLIKESKGGVGNMYYNDPRCSRAVLLKLAE